VLLPLTVDRPPPKDDIESADAVSREKYLRVIVNALFSKKRLPPPLQSFEFSGEYDDKKENFRGE